jgi:hypothetical protein
MKVRYAAVLASGRYRLPGDFNIWHNESGIATINTRSWYLGDRFVSSEAYNNED